MRWLEVVALLLVSTGCTVHIVEQPAIPVLVAEPARPSHRVHVAARPTYEEQAAQSPRARPPHPPRARPPHPPRARPLEPQARAVPRAVPREPRPKQIAGAHAPAPRHRTPPKPKRSGRFKLQPNDVAPIESEPAGASRQTPARSTSVAKTQENALDLRQ